MMQKQALDTIKVCDFTWALAGPLMTKYLADYGATVVRVETASHPGFMRYSGPYRDETAGLDRSGYFAFYNNNKYSMTIDLNNPRGVEAAKKLIAWSDVVCENFTPNIMKKWGLSYNELKKIKPELVMVSSSGLGQTGPNAKISIGGNWLVALGGFTWVSGWPDRIPVQPFGVYTDFVAPRFGLAAILAALRYKRRTGRGQYIDLSQLETGMQLLAPLFLDYATSGRNAGRTGNSSPCAAPHGVYPCRGGKWCTIAVCDDREWQAFRRAIGSPAWTEESRFATLADRKRNEDELNKLVSAWTIALPGEQIMALMQKAGIAAGVVHNAEDLFADPQLRHRDTYWKVEHKAIGSYEHLGQTAILSKTPAQPRMPSPCLGEHTEYVCRQFLNMSDEEFTELFNEGAFGTF